MHARHLLGLIFIAAALAACGDGWREYRSEAGRYAVEFPSAKVVEHGLAVAVHIAYVEIDKATSYGVSWYDVPAPGKPSAALLVDMQAKVLRDLKATLVDASEIRLGPGDGVPGRAFTARTASGVDVSIRIYAVGTGPVRVYQLTAAVPDARKAEAEIRRFLASFKLLK